MAIDETKRVPGTTNLSVIACRHPLEGARVAVALHTDEGHDTILIRHRNPDEAGAGATRLREWLSKALPRVLKSEAPGCTDPVALVGMGALPPKIYDQTIDVQPPGTPADMLTGDASEVGTVPPAFSATGAVALAEPKVRGKKGGRR
jgi:hypothetical protein